ncbi:hypothetical protein PHYSODRAFT_534716, partial [Phytophthora sojae]
HRNFSASLKPNHWPRRRPPNMPGPGFSGRSGVNFCTYRSGSPQSERTIHINSPFLLPTAGSSDGATPRQATLPQPCSPRSAACRGIIGDFAGYSVGLTPGHQLAITGMRREDPPTNPKLPITLQFLKSLHKFLNFDFAQHRLLRKSEYLADGAKVKSYAIRRTDVRFLDSDDHEQQELKRVQKVQIRFRGSKTDQFGEGTTRTLEDRA